MVLCYSTYCYRVRVNTCYTKPTKLESMMACGAEALIDSDSTSDSWCNVLAQVPVPYLLTVVSGTELDLRACHHLCIHATTRVPSLI